MLACAAVAVGATVLAGCGSSGDGTARPSDWPMFGRTPERTQHLRTEDRAVDPPLRQAWSVDLHTLIYFPPIIADGVAYAVNRYGTHAVRLRDGEVLWRRGPHPFERSRRPNATPPVYSDGLLFLADRYEDLLAIDAATGELVWRKDYSHLDFSPLVVDGTVYIGEDETKLIALRASDGSVLWQFDSPRPLSDPSYHEGRLYFSIDEGTMYCMDAASGRVLWRTDTTKVPPRPSGEVVFYPPPVVAFGRVYAARTDGKLFALDRRSGEVEWSSRVPDFLARSPAVARVPGTPPTVYIGSYGKYFYALNALTGKQEWRYRLGSTISGSASIIGHTVYAPIRSATGPPQQVVGIDVRTHKESFRATEAEFAPVSDGSSLYLVDAPNLIKLEPK